MEIATRSAGNLVAEVAKFMLKNIKLQISYVFHHKRRVQEFEKKVETLKERRDRVQHKVDDAERNAENIETDVNNWLAKVDIVINAEAKEVKDLKDKAENKCFIGLCPNFKSRYQLSKKAEEEISTADELLQQGGFELVSYREVPQGISIASPKDFEAFDSRKQIFNEILEALKDPSINLIGVYGMPGVGKTTLVKEVARQVKEDKLFDLVVMAAVTQIPDIQKIQDQIADMLGLKFEEQSMTGRASRLCETLKKKKILVVLDDIWARLDLMEVGIPYGAEYKKVAIPFGDENKELAIPFGDEPMRCTVLITSRDLFVLSNGMGAHTTFQIGILSREEAWDLFKKTAGNNVESLDLRSTATKVANECAGLPIAISTVAKALRNKPSFAWRDALRQLSEPSSSNFNGVPAEAYSVIELSYNYLESEELKQTFLLCSMMPHNAYIKDLLNYAMGLRLFHGVRTVETTRDRLLTMVSHLKDSSLLRDSYNNLRFDMHDLISDVGISIASKDKRVFAFRHEDVLNEHDWPDGETTKRWDKISLRSPGISKLPDQLKCPKLSFFYMLGKDPLLKIPTEFFKEMANLKVLNLRKMHFPSLPSSICLLANLRTLCLHRCVLGDVNIIGQLKDLEILSLRDSDIDMLPKEIGQLIKLKLLDLTNCAKLKTILPNTFSSLSRLEELYMGNSFVQWEADGHLGERSNASIDELKALSSLTTLHIHIPNARMIPKDLFFEKLQRYIVVVGEAWDWRQLDEREYKRTLKLKLHTSIGHLSYGMKMLKMKAQNLYVDEMKDLEILLPMSESRECLQQLENLYIQNGALIQYIIEDNDVHKTEFLQLKSLTLQGLPKLISFCSQNRGSTSISPQGQLLFNEKIVFPKLENLKLSSISVERIWEKVSHSMQNLTSCVVEGCGNLKYVLSYSMVECLQQLKCLEIIDCNSIQEIISREEIMKEEYGERAAISFPQLNSLKLKGLQRLMGFCHEDYIVEFQSLNILEIKHCPELKGFIIDKPMGKDIPTDGTDIVLFNRKVAFPNLEKMSISHVKNVKRIWHNQLHGDSFCKLKNLKVEYCDDLLNIFSSFQIRGVFQFQRLEMLGVTDCASLEEVFEFQGLDIEEANVVAMQLREMRLMRLPKMKHVWNKDSHGNISFRNLRVVDVRDCQSLKSLFPFSIAEGLLHLEKLLVDRCGVEEIVSKNIEEIQEEICFEFNQLSFLKLWLLPDLKWFYPGQHTIVWPVLKKLWTHRCGNIKIFGKGESQIQQPLFLIEKVIPQLEEVYFKSDDIAKICDGQYATNFFHHVKILRITYFGNESDLFPSYFLQGFHNLEILEVSGCNIKELSSHKDDVGKEKDMNRTLLKIKRLNLITCHKITHLWKQGSQLDHICASLETLQVWLCHSLINLASASLCFQNLTTLDVFKCNGMVELITSSQAQSSARLVTMKIEACGMMTKIVASEEDEATYGIIFRELKSLELYCLQSLKSFCSGNYSFKFPSLERVTVRQCPRLKSFCKGVLCTPKLQGVFLKKLDYKGRWAGDLNATIQQLHEEKVGFNGLKQLKFSEFPELMDIWNRNPQKILDMENLKFLEICNSNELRCIFNLSMAMSLWRLQRIEIKRCNKMEQVINEAEEATVDHKIINIFSSLKSISVESCPLMTSFYSGSLALVYPSLESIVVADCPNMTTLVSTFSRDKDKDAMIGTDGTQINKDDTNSPTAFFCDKIVFPKLENLKLSSISMERIWEKAFHSMRNLTSCIIKGCGNLKHMFSYSMVECLQQLKWLEIIDCNSIQEIISREEITKEEYGKRVAISFPRLNSLMLKGLPKLLGFCHEDYIVEFQSLNNLEIEHCPELRGFPTDSSDRVLFKGKVAFPNLEKMRVSHVRNVKRIWHNQLHGDSFCKLKELKVEYCDDLLNIFSSFQIRGVFQRLEMLRVTDCASLEEVFEFQGLDIEEASVVALQLREMHLFRLPEMKNVWNKDSNGNISFQNLRVVNVLECRSLKSLFPFSIAKGLRSHLERLLLDKCGVEEIVSKNIEEIQEEICFEFNQLSFLKLWILPDLKWFYPGQHTIVWPVLRKLWTYKCGNIKIFGKGESQIQQPLFLIEKVIPQLEEVQYFSNDDIAMLCDRQYATDLFHHVKVLGIAHFLNESDLFPSYFLQGFHNLEMLMVRGRNFKELFAHKDDVGKEKDMSRTLKKIKRLKLNNCYKMTHLWKQGSQLDYICASLETLEVRLCHSLINLSSASSCFQNLTTLDVFNCNGMAKLITSSKAQTLVRLVTMKIEECGMMTEIVACEEDEATYKIILRELKTLELNCLQSLESFCSGNYSFKFPSLKRVTVSQCPRLKSFCKGVLYTPKLQRVFLKTADYKGRWAGDLDATIQQLHKEKVGYNGLKQLKFSEFPELMDIWNINPQEILDMKKLEFLEICNSNELRCIFNLSMALSLWRLQHLEIKRCNKMEQVINEAEESTAENEITNIFSSLKSISVESCPHMTSFHLGSLALVYPSLESIVVVDCPNMTTFVSTFSRDIDKDAMIGTDRTQINEDDPDSPTAFFCDKIVFPRLENLKLSSISPERIWEKAFHSIQNLTSCIIEDCGNLKHVLSYSMVECLQQLKCLEIIGCNSIQEIISREEITKEEYGRRAAISFPRLNSLILKGLPKVLGFCHEDYIVEFQSLNNLEIEHCPELRGFPTDNADRVLFKGKVAFPKLEKVRVSHMRNVKRIWHNQLHGDSFCKLKELKVEYCDDLLNIFSSFQIRGVFQRLEMLIVTDCASLEEVFEFQGLDIEEASVVALQLREMHLFHLPKMKNVWNKDSHGNIYFQNLRVVNVSKCQSLKSLFPFSIAEGLLHLEKLIVDRCGVEEIVSKNIEETQEEICFAFNQLSFLKLWILPDLKWFYPGQHSIVWPVLKKLWTYRCRNIKIFGKGESQFQQPLFLIEKVIPQLEEVNFSNDDIAMICDGQYEVNFFSHVKTLGITHFFNESDLFPSYFLQRFHNLEMLVVRRCNFKELSAYEDDVGKEKDMSQMLPKIKKLKLFSCYNITHIWKQGSQLDHVCACLETLQVQSCDSLINLASASGSCFQNLTTLDVANCNRMVELISSSKAQNLVCLVTMKIIDCEMMTEIISSEEDEATYEIIFRDLKSLELDCLQSLKSFCLWNYNFKFPSLERVIVSRCPRLKSFCKGVLCTPKLQRVFLNKTDYKGRWAGDLNVTIQQLHEDKGFKAPMLKNGQGWIADLYKVEGVSTEGIEMGNGYTMSIPNETDRLSHVQTKNGVAVAACFPMDSFLIGGFRLPMEIFFVDVCEYYGIAPSQIHPQHWRLLTTFFIGFRQFGEHPTVNLFRAFYRISGLSGGYYFSPRYKPIIEDHLFVHIPHEWKSHFVVVHAPLGGFQCDVTWRRPRVEFNLPPHGLSIKEQELLEKFSHVVFKTSVVESQDVDQYFDEWQQAKKSMPVPGEVINLEKSASSESGKQPANLLVESLTPKHASTDTEADITEIE